MTQDNTGHNDAYVLSYRREDLNWRAFVFLPFNFAWRIVMALFGCIYFSSVIFIDIFLNDSYRATEMDRLDNLLKIISCCHFVDFLLSIFHRLWGPVQKSMPHQPKPLIILIVDFIVVLPIRWFLISGSLISEKGTIHWYRIIQLNGCLSVYRVFVELIGLQKKMWFNPILVCIIQQNTIMLSSVSVFSSIWYVIGIMKKNRPLSWLNDIPHSGVNLDENNPTEMYIFSFIHVYVSLSSEAVTHIRALNHLETCFIIFLFSFGNVVRYSFAIWATMQSYLKYQGHMYKIKDVIKVNKKCLIYPKTQKLISQYYISFWDNWMGLRKCPVLENFPLCLQKDILTDVYWDAIEHSHVLRHFPVNIKRGISMVMQAQFMQPGDYIFRKGQLRSTYHYIASGVVQIMSHYDGVSPIMTITSGSCLGGISLALPSVCPTDVVCATACELRTLTFQDFYNALRSYVNGVVIIKSVVVEHMEHVRMVHILSKAYKKEDPIMKLYGVPQDDKLKWIKSRWRTIRNLDSIHGTSSDVNINKIIKNNLPDDVRHTSRYLDCVVLSSQMKFDADRCCKYTSCPYTLEPNCNFVNKWLTFLFVIITIDCISVPYCAAFIDHTPEILVRWDHLVFFVYSLDIYFQGITAVKFLDNTISEPLPLFRYHLTDLSFLIDVVATIPIREVMRLFVVEASLSPYLALNRLLRIVRVFSFFKRKYNNITSGNIITHVFKYIYIFSFISYFSACFFFMLACSFKNGQFRCLPHSWYEQLVNDLNVDSWPTADDIGDNITISLYRVLKLVTRSGLTATPLKRLDDIIYSSVVIFISRNVLNFYYAEMIAMNLMKRQRRLACTDLQRSLKSVLTVRNIHPALVDMVDSYISLQWNTNYAVDFKTISTDSDTMSTILKNERNYIIFKNIKKIPFFKLMDSKILNKIVSACNIYVVPKDYIFCRSGELSTNFTMILKGICRKTSMLKEDWIENPDGMKVGPGAYFPLMECLQNICCLQTIYSLTVCEVISIDAITFYDILLTSTTERFDLMISIATNFKETDLDIVINKRKYRKNDRYIPSFVKRTLPKASNQNGAHSLKTRCNVFSFLFTPPFIIHPQGLFMFIWETLKLIQVIVTLFYVPAMYTLICTNKITTYGIALILDIFSLFDVLVRMYLGHFNSIGILVHKPGYYISHSFTVDIVSSFPIYLFVVDYTFTGKFFITCCFKVLQIYRIPGFLNALRFKFGISTFKLLLISFFVYTFLLLYLIAQVVYVITCELVCTDKGMFDITCNRDSWLTHTFFFDRYNRDPLTLVFYFACFVMYVVLGNDQGRFLIRTVKEMKSILALIVVACILKCYYFPKAVSLVVGGYQHFTKHRDNHRLYWSYINNEGGNKEVAKKTYNYFVYNFARTNGIDIKTCTQAIHPSLHYDLTFALYYKAMRCLTAFVGENKMFLKLLANKVNEVHYQRDSTVIIINGVSDRIHFICEGHIDIFNYEEEMVKTLGPGSMFGAFNRSGMKKHKFKFMSKFHCTLLEIKTVEFLTVLRSYNSDCYNRFLLKTKVREYWEYYWKSDSHTYNVMKMTDETEERPRILHEDSIIYKWVMFFLSMIVPYLTAFPVLFCISTGAYSQVLYPDVMMYLLDMISLARIFLGFNVIYTDEFTGVSVSDLRVVRHAYITTPTRFLLDLLSILPFELIGFVFTSRWISYLKANRLLKLYIMYLYIEYYSQKTYVKIYLRWFEFITLVTLPLFSFTCIWIYITCDNGCLKKHDIIYLNITDPYEKLLNSMNDIFTLLSFGTSFDQNKPWNLTECIVITLYNIIGFVLLPTLIAKFIQTATMSNFNKRTYEYNIYCMKLYLQLRDLSASLLERLWNYSLLLYTTNKGHELPHFVKNAPLNMKADLFFDLYGGHIRYNVLFENCNSDLTYQLTALLKRAVYFPGDFIIRKLDVDGCMYFVNSGEVDEIEFDEMHIEKVSQVYITGQCFGLGQGLYARMPHFHYYKARTMVEILTLHRDDWLHFAHYFPEDFKQIYYMSRKMELDVTF